MKKLPRPKRKARGKGKPSPIEAKRLARDFQRLKRLEANSPKREENRAVVSWAKQWIGERLSSADADTFDHLAHELLTREPKAERVIRAYWSHWNMNGLQWKERQAEMVRLGFPGFEDMKRTSFESLCRRMGLKYYRH
jgi:hypothetical protein